MFTINIYLRFALIVGSLLLGIGLAIAYGFWYGFPFILAAIILLVGYILLGTVQSASELLQAQQLDEAEERLKLTKFPDLLFPANKAYYYMIQANIALTRKDTKKAEGLLKKASEIEMPSSNDTAAIQVQLASIAAQRGNWGDVNQRIRMIRKLDVSEPMTIQQVEQLEKAYRNRGNVRVAQRTGMAHRSSKRRRPKMR